MKFLTAVHTDIGIKKKTNQDSCLIMEAGSELGEIILAVICDGMGGLAKGEVASSVVIRAFKKWFENDLPELLCGKNRKDVIFSSWETLVVNLNRKISDYGHSLGINLGTTVCSFLVVENEYYIMNVGDSRAYCFFDRVYQLTKDQTYIQREMDMGRMTAEEAKTSPKRSVLLQCVGAIDYLAPDFYTGTVSPGQIYMLCSDGFRHVITEEELMEHFNPSVADTEEKMKNEAVYLTDLNKYRRESDNISVILVRVD